MTHFYYFILFVLRFNYFVVIIGSLHSEHVNNVSLTELEAIKYDTHWTKLLNYDKFELHQFFKKIRTHQNDTNLTKCRDSLMPRFQMKVLRELEQITVTWVLVLQGM